MMIILIQRVIFTILRYVLCDGKTDNLQNLFMLKSSLNGTVVEAVGQFSEEGSSDD